MEQGVWQEIELLYQKFQKLGISEAVDYDKYYLYSLITHSTAIEGSTLTELDTQLLFDEGVTAKGKPLVHHLMNEDLKQAYELAKTESGSLVPITPAFLKRLNAMLMRTTGSVHSVLGGSFDSSKGEFRLCGVTAGVGGHSYMLLLGFDLVCLLLNILLPCFLLELLGFVLLLLHMLQYIVYYLFGSFYLMCHCIFLLHLLGLLLFQLHSLLHLLLDLFLFLHI